MNYRLVEQKALTVVGKDCIIRTDAFKEIPVFVEEIWTNGTHVDSLCMRVTKA